MAELDQETYQPEVGDIRIQEARRGRARRFKVYVYRQGCWEQFGDRKICTFSEQDVQELTVPPWRFIGEGERQREKYLYYRHAECDEGRIPQFPHESAWDQHRIIPLYPLGSELDPKDYVYAPYFYEHITLEEAERLERTATDRLYKIVCLRPYDHYHKNTYFVKGAFLTEFLQHPMFRSLCPNHIVSIEPVETMPSTDEKLTGA